MFLYSNSSLFEPLDFNTMIGFFIATSLGNDFETTTNDNCVALNTSTNV